MKSPHQFVMFFALTTALALTGCGSSPGENVNQSGPRSGLSGPGSKARPKGSPEDEGSIVSAGTVKKGTNPRDFSQDPPPADRTVDEPATEIPSYSKKQVTADLSNLSSTEKSLLAFGLQVVVSKDGKGNPKSVDWDYRLMDSVDVSIFDAIPALENYAKVGHEFLAKYDKEFLVDGTKTTSERLAQREIATVVAKIQLVENSVDSLKKKAAKKK